MRCTGCFSELEEGETAYATVVGSIEQFDGDYDDRMFLNQIGAVSILSTGRFSMVMFTRIEDEDPQSSLFPWRKYFILSDGFGELDHIH